MEIAPKDLRARVTFIVPFFNEAENLPVLVNLLDAFAGTTQFARPVVFDAIFIDDGSRDGGAELLKVLARKLRNFKIRLIRLSRNFGKEVALTAGISAADSDAVVLLDADLQHPVALVDKFLAGWLEDDCDVVYAYREKKTRPGLINRFMVAGFYRFINSGSEVAVPANAGDFRLMSRRAYSAMRQLGEHQRFMKGLYSWIGFRQKGIPFTPARRRRGKSKFSPVRLWLLAIDGITSFSILPLRFAVFAGAGIALLAAGYGVWSIFIKYYYQVDPPGYPTLIVAIAFIGAAQLIFLGVIGEYVGKILMEVKARPLFIVASDEALDAASEARPVKLV